jgi:hypothetical protein
MENLKPFLDLAHQYLPPDLWNKCVLAVGYAGILGQIVPLLLSWGVPAAGNAADAVARFFLATPFRPLILYFAPAIVKFLDSLTAAFEKIADTFKARLEQDLAQAAATASPAASPPTPAPEAAGVPKS